LAGADTVFDVIALPAETPLIVAARTAGKHVITGAEVIALQAADSSERYTGVRPTPSRSPKPRCSRGPDPSQG
jgi:shikimate dehydrogenase